MVQTLFIAFEFDEGREREREMRTFWSQYFQQQEMVLNVNRTVLYVHLCYSRVKNADQ